MSGKVRMTHPVSGGEYDALPEQVPHLQAAGWQQAPGQDAVGEVWPAEAQRFDGQQQVKIRHPETGGETVVAASAVAYHQEKGWQVVDEAGDEAGDELDGLTVAQLQGRARESGLPVSGTKAELLERIRTAGAPAAQEQDGDQ